MPLYNQAGALTRLCARYVLVFATLAAQEGVATQIKSFEVSGAEADKRLEHEEIEVEKLMPERERER